MESRVTEIRQQVERSDEALVDLLLSTPDREEPRLKVGVVCPLCQSETEYNQNKIKYFKTKLQEG